MQPYLNKLLRGEDLSPADTQTIFELLANGEVAEAPAAALLMGLAMKGETVEEIVAAVGVMRRRMQCLELDFPTLDTCGTGGDGQQTINVSTAAAFVAAAAGLKVAKHGNRSVSSKSGSMDVVEALGINVALTPHQAEACLRATGLVFLYAPLYHPVMKHIAPIRKALGVRTIFNFMGPLLNPAGAAYQLIGVSSSGLAEKLGQTLIQLGSKKVLLVHSQDGLDEISVSAPTTVFEFNAGKPAEHYTIEPDRLYPIDKVRGGSPLENAESINAILQGKGNPAEQEFVRLNAAGAILAGNGAPDFASAKKIAGDILERGQAYDVLRKVITFTTDITL